jgi:hypothetical protein
MRKVATEAALAARDIRPPRSLPPVIAEVEVDLRDPRDVVARVIALFLCAVRAESLASGRPIPVSDLEKKLPLAMAATSPKERAFLAAAAPNERDVVNHVWRYESVVPLAWSLGVLDELPFPSAVCDVAVLAKTLFGLDAQSLVAQSLVASARLRGTSEILDALDLTFRLHWATTNARVRKTASPAGVEPGVVAERHHALNWLTRFEDAEWDDVTTPT